MDPSGELEKGYIVRLQSGEKASVELATVIPLENPMLAYNFQVEEHNNYFVSNGCVLVHNMRPEGKEGKEEKNQKIA